MARLNDVASAYIEVKNLITTCSKCGGDIKAKVPIGGEVTVDCPNPKCGNPATLKCEG